MQAITDRSSSTGELPSIELTSPSNDVSKRVLDVSKRALAKTISVSAPTVVASAYVVGGVALIGACSTIPVAAVYTLGIIGLVAFFATPPGWLAAGGLLGVFITTAILYLAYKLCITALQSYLQPKITETISTSFVLKTIIKESTQKPIRSTLCLLAITPLIDVAYPVLLAMKTASHFFNSKDSTHLTNYNTIKPHNPLQLFNMEISVLSALPGITKFLTKRSPKTISHGQGESPRHSFEEKATVLPSNTKDPEDSDVEFEESPRNSEEKKYSQEETRVLFSGSLEDEVLSSDDEDTPPNV